MYMGAPLGSDSNTSSTSAIVVLFVLLGMLLLFFNGIIHNGSPVLETTYTFFFWSAFFVFIVDLFLASKKGRTLLLFFGIVSIGLFSIYSHYKAYSLTAISGDYYMKNEKVVYFSAGNYDSLDGLNLGSYKIIGEQFVKDDQAVYFGSVKIEGLDLDTYSILFFEGEETPYIKDKKSVFYGAFLLENADPSTFQVIDPVYSFYAAKDKNYTYEEEQRFTISANGEKEYVPTTEEQGENEEKTLFLAQKNKAIADYKEQEIVGIIDYITGESFPEVYIAYAQDEIASLLDEGTFSVGLDRSPQKTYRLYQIYLNDDPDKAMRYLRRSSDAFYQDWGRGLSSFLARYDYAFRLLEGNGVAQDIDVALALFQEFVEVVEEIQRYDGLSNSANNEKYSLSCEWCDVEFAPRPMKVLEIYYETCYLLGRVYLEGEIVPQNSMLASRYIIPLESVHLSTRDRSIEDEVRFERYSNLLKALREQ